MIQPGDWQNKANAAVVDLTAALMSTAKPDEALMHLYDARASVTDAIEALEEQEDL